MNLVEAQPPCPWRGSDSSSGGRGRVGRRRRESGCAGRPRGSGPWCRGVLSAAAWTATPGLPGLAPPVGPSDDGPESATPSEPEPRSDRRTGPDRSAIPARTPPPRHPPRLECGSASNTDGSTEPGAPRVVDVESGACPVCTLQGDPHRLGDVSDRTPFDPDPASEKHGSAVSVYVRIVAVTIQ